MLKNVAEGVRKEVYETYADTPDDIKEQLIEKVLTDFSEVNKSIGNYYLVSYLYPSEVALSADEIADNLKNDPLHHRNATAFASVAEILSNPDFADESKQFHVEAFLFRESRRFYLPLRGIVGKAFEGPPEPGQYQPPPAELVAAGKKLYEEMVEQGKRRMEEARKPADYQDVADEVLEGLSVATDEAISGGTENVAQASDEPIPTELSPETAGTAGETQVEASSAAQTTWWARHMKAIVGVGIMLVVVVAGVIFAVCRQGRGARG